VIHNLSRDGNFLFITRIARMFGYGFLSVVLILYLEQVGLSQVQIGLLLTLTLIGDTIISLWITTHADRIGRRRMLLIGATLMIFAGILFAITRNFVFLLIAATIGVISPSGYEVGPFLSIEQAALSQIVSNERRTHIFAWYNLVGSFATALGALVGGGLVQTLQDSGVTPLGSYRMIVIGYAIIGFILGILFTRLSSAVEIQATGDPKPSTSAFKTRFGLHRSKAVVF
jgi:MFS family permease